MAPTPTPIHIDRRRQQSIDPTISKRARIPASSKAILGLKEVVLLTTTTAGTTDDDDDDNCAICLKPLADPADHDKEEPTAADVDNITKLRAMPCFHTFHQHCIFEWLRRSAACPLCRRQLPTTDDDDDDDDDDYDDDDNDD
ncbi:hypothetical protein BDA96_04G047900 [Sorghum bicolor]|uniref:RING-type domain-containing protein n=2 Tax=Sorghum bicolor TaxID=4558 RepID=A0A921R1Q6_SORBI|nr:hypothetical protein BDA96_04G047900 [Sorghum bicolor]KXG29489.2 hypothetical protein SORBI_3004G043301 [Sorghum bicolor]